MDGFAVGSSTCKLDMMHDECKNNYTCIIFGNARDKNRTRRGGKNFTKHMYLHKGRRSRSSLKLTINIVLV
jgi:hypothetical protein